MIHSTLNMRCDFNSSYKHINNGSASNVNIIKYNWLVGYWNIIVNYLRIRWLVKQIKTGNSLENIKSTTN